MMGINTVDSELIYHRGGIRPRAAVFIKCMKCCKVPSFVTKDLVALRIKIGESGDQTDWLYVLNTFHQTLGRHLPLKN